MMLTTAAVILGKEYLLTAKIEIRTKNQMFRGVCSRRTHREGNAHACTTNLVDCSLQSNVAASVGELVVLEKQEQ